MPVDAPLIVIFICFFFPPSLLCCSRQHNSVVFFFFPKKNYLIVYVGWNGDVAPPGQTDKMCTLLVTLLAALLA